jgi:CDP-glucose 4,6-dehydratase
MAYAFMHHKAVVIRNPKAIRPWQHVLEPLRGYLDLTQKLYEEGPSFAEAWNFGPNNEDVKPVEWIVKTMAERWGEDARWTIDQGENPHEANFLRLDITKASHDLNWQPRMNLSDALDQIIHWYKAYINKADMHQITCDQIKQYSEQISLRKM